MAHIFALSEGQSKLKERSATEKEIEDLGRGTWDLENAETY
jgi:hypothetical protein